MNFTATKNFRVNNIPQEFFIQKNRGMLVSVNYTEITIKNCIDDKYMIIVTIVNKIGC